MNKRIEKEFNGVVGDPPKGVQVKKAPEAGKWEIILDGPENTVY